MKYKVGDKVFYKGVEWQVNDSWVNKISGWDTYKLKNGDSQTVVSDFQFQERKIDYESTIINLNELNTTKSRQIERLMKFIAKDYSIRNDLDYNLIRETLLKDIRDEDLVNAIMYHVRKGKWHENSNNSITHFINWL